MIEDCDGVVSGGGGGLGGEGVRTGRLRDNSDKESSSRMSLGLERVEVDSSLVPRGVLKSKHGYKSKRDFGGIIGGLCWLGGVSDEEESDSDDSIG